MFKINTPKFTGRSSQKMIKTHTKQNKIALFLRNIVLLLAQNLQNPENNEINLGLFFMKNLLAEKDGQKMLKDGPIAFISVISIQ